MRNCLNFNTEIESIYLYDNFCVECNGDFTTPRENVSEFTGSFSIKKQKKDVNINNVVFDGYPFFQGELNVTKTFDVDAIKPTELYVNGRYSVCDVMVNDNYVGRLMYKNHCDITKYIKEGENVLELKMYNSQRNLLGPHHFIDPEPLALGPVNFSLENMWTEDGCGAHKDRYSFVRLGADVSISL